MGNAIFISALLAGIFLSATLRGQTLDVIGVTALRAITTNLDGRGIHVAQPEASLSTDLLTWLVDPAQVGQPTALFTYESSVGSASTYPNSLGTNSWHAQDVGNVFYGIPNGVATNLAQVDNLEANYFYTNYIANNSLPAIGDLIVNQSFTFGNEPSEITVLEQQQVDSQYDNYAAQNRTLFVSAVNNGGNVSPPGTSYNCIGVAAYYPPGANSSIGPTLDNGRCKPDITAPSGYTSFSTPYVSGAAALMAQAGLRGDGGSDTNSASDVRMIKALLLNGAIKPPDWTNGSSAPLDARYGAGVVNVLNSYEQLAGGKQGSIVSNQVSSGGVHPPTGATGTVTALSGWNFSTNTSGSFPPSSFDTVHHYYFNVSNQIASVKFIATATLVWNRHYNATYLISPISINNLNLFLYNCANSNLITCSTSLVDNVEHLYITNLAQGRYDLQVWKAGGAGIVSAAEPYALAWQFVPAPTLALAQTGTNVNLTWPLYPAGFRVEALTNLLTNNWSTNNLPPAGITNGLRTILLNPTNATQFFRLHLQL